MKGLKLSKTSWLILSAGIFIVVLAGLGVTRSNQLKEQNQLEEELSLSALRVDTIKVTPLRPQLDELQQRIDESESQLNEVKDRLRQSVISVDVTEKFFAIAEYCDVVVQSLSTTVISTDKLAGINCYEISISAVVVGDVENIVDFLISLNEGYTTGYVTSSQISIPTEDREAVPTASFHLDIYTYTGN